MDRALKQRLVGASVLIILAVIVLPMLLSGRSDTLKQESRQIELPPKPEELSIETRRFPIGLPNKPSPASASEPTGQKGAEILDSEAGGDKQKMTGVAGLDDAKQLPADIESKPEVVAGSADNNTDAGTDSGASAMAQVHSKPPAVTSITLESGREKGLDVEEVNQNSPDVPRYLVQVASFSSEKNANALAARLRADNFPVLMDVVERLAGRMHRVRVGPYTGRLEANEVVDDLKFKMTDLSPRVLDLRPTESSPVSTPSDPLVRWVVQVGSFSTSEAADALVAELRLAGMNAYSEKVSSAGSTAYKVRIGPELDREKSVELARKVKAERQLDAFVTTQE